MKAFTVTAHSVTVGLKVHQDPYPHVKLGEPGEHQTSLRIPLAKREWTTPTKRIERCDLKYLQPKGNRKTFVLRPEVNFTKEQRDEEFKRQSKRIFPYTMIANNKSDALVLVDIRGRPNGETAWTTARQGDRICPLRGKHIAGSTCPVCGTERVHGMHPNTGDYLDYGQFPPHLIEVIAHGYIRYDKDHPDHPSTSHPPWAHVYLLRMKPRSVFRVHRGYDKGQANERIIRWTGEHIELGSASELLEDRLVLQDEDVDAVQSTVLEAAS